jgi:hypothetical protein
VLWAIALVVAPDSMSTDVVIATIRFSMTGLLTELPRTFNATPSESIRSAANV